MERWQEIVLTAILSAIGTIATGMFLFDWQIREPQLIYGISGGILNSMTHIQGTDWSLRTVWADAPIPPFWAEPENGTSVLANYIISIGNAGNKEAEEVFCIISEIDGVIHECTITAEPTISYIHQKTNETIEVRLPFLNPTEVVDVSLLMVQNESKKPKVSLRGIGCVGVEKRIGESPKVDPLMLLFFMTGLILLSSIFYMAMQIVRL